MTRIISSKKNGFNLLTMSIVITIVGIIMSSVVSYYKINNIKLRIKNMILSRMEDLIRNNNKEF